MARGILVYVFDCTLDPLYVILLALFNDVTMIPVAEDPWDIPGVDFLGGNFILAFDHKSEGSVWFSHVSPPHLTELRLQRLKKDAPAASSSGTLL